MKRIVVGILAHVDSGKTTLSEGMLFAAGKIRRQGRVDHGDAYLDTDSIERERGITIFSKQAVFGYGDTEFTLLDTPGHVDFAAETERTLQVLDYAVLVISASDGVQPHTETLWRLLKRHRVPTFIFVNKMDLPDTFAEKILEELNKRLDEGCVDFGADKTSDEFADAAAMCSEELMEEYLETGAVSRRLLAEAVMQRKMFPCRFGCALSGEGVTEFLEELDRYTVEPPRGEKFGAKVFKISDGGRGVRLTYMKITGGVMRVKDIVDPDLSEKVNEIRIYSGEKYDNVSEACAGTVCAVTGLSQSRPGQGYGAEQDSEGLMSEPIFSYTVNILDGTDPHTALQKLRRLEQEETQLFVSWDERSRKIGIRLMGEVQLEVLRRIIAERFDMKADFEKGGIVYRETIADKVEGVGHYEPLRHYAEVHLLLEPLPRGSGLKFATKCSEDELDRNWQRLILTHLEEKTHLGVLTGSPICDMKITLIAGRAHLKHTEGGDFRQATYRAVRQGLMRAKSVLLEPWFEFRMELPCGAVGRAMTDINQMGGRMSPPETNGETSVISGFAPAAKIGGYRAELTAYTSGMGQLSCTFCGYEPCADSENIIEEIGYNAEADTDNTADSVFCAHGAGFNVKWNEVFDHMHLPAAQLEVPVVKQTVQAVPRRSVSFADDKELMRIFEQTYGKIERRAHHAMHTPKNDSPPVRRTGTAPKPKNGNYLLVDGYNVIFAWKELKEAAAEELDMARTMLINRLCAYRAMRDVEVIAVFDAYRVKGNPGSVEKVNNISVVYTKEAETADSYIEKATKRLEKNHNVMVATSDYMEQLIILGNGAYRIPTSEFIAEVEAAEAEIRDLIAHEF